MTDKQIIIDGVDVSGCKCYNPNIKMDCLLYPLQSDVCKNNPNCHYKLYKRKEQECEQQKAELELFKTSNQTTIDQLKKENDALFKAIEEVNKINKKLESENEDLKKTILQECPNCGEEYLNYKGAALYFENSDLKQTLTEIKEIILFNKVNRLSGGAYVTIEQILQKINECEEQ